ncbi:MAG: hypothetical protein ACJAX5_002009 [Patiriisocius sp.]
MIVQYRSVHEFNEISFRGPGLLEVHQGEIEALSIEAPGAILEQIVSRVDSGTLHLGFQPQKISVLSIYRSPIRYRLDVRELSNVRVSGHGRVIIPDLDTDNLTCRLTGRSSIRLDQLTSDLFDVTLADAAQMQVKGDIESQVLSLKGKANYEAEDLMSDSADIRLSDCAKAQIRVNDLLTAYVGGQATLSYIGYPELSKTGAGNIVRKRKQLADSTLLNHVKK